LPNNTDKSDVLCQHLQDKLNCEFCAAKRPYHITAPVKVGNRFFKLTANDLTGTDGCKLWHCSFALAQILDKMSFEGLTVCEVGAGLGLPGLVAASQGGTVTFIDKDPWTRPFLTANLEINQLTGTIATINWAEINAPFDIILGSEILYGGYEPDRLADFIKRNWTGKGPCLITNAIHAPRTDGTEFFTNEIKRRGLTSAAEVISGIDVYGNKFSCNLWSVYLTS